MAAANEAGIDKEPCKFQFFLLTLILCSSAAFAQATATVPVFNVTPLESAIKIGVKASVAIQGTLDK
jgi:hypothetical protein